MGFDIVDGPQPGVAIEVIGTTPRAPEAATEALIWKQARVSTSSTDWVDVTSWTVSTGKVGILLLVEWEADDYTHTQLRILEDGADKTGTLTIYNSQGEGPLGIRYAAGRVLKIQCKSSDGSAINVDGVIIGKEVG